MKDIGGFGVVWCGMPATKSCLTKKRPYRCDLAPIFLSEYPWIVFYFLSPLDWLIRDNSFTASVTCSSLIFKLQPAESALGWTGPVWSQTKLFVLSLVVWSVTSSHVESHNIITLCKYNCWRDDRRDFTSPLNTNLIFQWRSQAPHCSQSSLSLIVWTKSMNSRILCVYDLREERGL